MYKRQLHIRAEAEHRAIESGANPATVEVDVEIDASLNRVRAIAMGTTELVRKDCLLYTSIADTSGDFKRLYGCNFAENRPETIH